MSNTTTPATLVSPYKAAALVNEALKEAGVTKTIPPQMMYNYAKKSAQPKGWKPFNVKDGKVVVDEKFAGWLQKYVTKQQALVTA